MVTVWLMVGSGMVMVYGYRLGRVDTVRMMVRVMVRVMARVVDTITVMVTSRIYEIKHSNSIYQLSCDPP